MPDRLRPELPALPVALANLPVHRGYPVPWFVAWLDEGGRACPRGRGTPDFRIIHPGALEEALARSACWVCGETMRDYPVAFLVGPMCAVNRTSSEPPSHPVCANWSARACPFLARPHAHRRTDGAVEAAVVPAGIMLRRNPGVALVWLTREPGYRRVRGGILFDLGTPAGVRWWAHGRRANRAEVLASIESGLPALTELAEAQGPDAVCALAEAHDRAMQLVPA